MPDIVPNFSSLLYDGTNAEAVIEWIPGAENVSVAEDGTIELTVSVFGSTYAYRVPPGSWAVRGTGVFQGALSPEDYQMLYIELPGT